MNLVDLVVKKENDIRSRGFRIVCMTLIGKQVKVIVPPRYDPYGKLWEEAKALALEIMEENEKGCPNYIAAKDIKMEIERNCPIGNRFGIDFEEFSACKCCDNYLACGTCAMRPEE